MRGARVRSDINQFEKIRSNLVETDFLNPDARRLFRVLEDCFNSKTFSIPDILTRCDNKALSQVITNEISSGVYQKDNIDTIVNDTIRFIQKNKIDEQREILIKRIRDYVVVTEDDKKQLDNLSKNSSSIKKLNRY